MSEVEILLNNLEEKEIRFWLDDEKLCYQAPKGAMNSEMMSKIKKHKESIIMFLKLNSKKSSFEKHENARYEQFPLTNIQNSYVVGRNNAYTLGDVNCHGYIEITYDEELNASKLEDAWNQVIKKHDMLRDIVYPEGYQKVQKNVPHVCVPFFDFRCLDKVTVEKKRENVRSQYIEKKYELGTWPMCDLVLSVEDGKSVIHFSLDMLITDFMSANILLDDLDRYYHDLPVDSEVPTLYRDIVIYGKKKEDVKDEAYKKDMAYWEEKIPTMGGAPELYTGVPADRIDKLSFRQVKYFIDGKGKSNIYEVAKKLKTTPSALILSAFGETMNLWSKNNTFCVNMTMNNRDQSIPDVSKVVGDFTDVNVFSFDYSKPMKFRDRINSIQGSLFDDIAHNHVSGVEVLRELGRSKKENLIIPVVYTSTLGVVSSTDSFLSRNCISFKLSQTPQVWIDCQVSEENGGITLNWDYRTGVFADDVISQMFNDFTGLVQKFANADENVFDAIAPIPLRKDTAETRENRNNVIEDYPDERMEAGFIRSIMAYPNKTALITKDGEYTYEVLAKHALAVRDALVAEGIKKGDLVGVMLSKNVWQTAGVLGTLLAGGTYLPIDPAQPVQRRNAIIEDSGTEFVLAEVKEELSNSDRLHVIDVRELTPASEVSGIECGDGSTEGPAYIIYTSGTTGRPKGVVISHKAAMNTIYDINSRYDIGKDDVFLGLANLAFDLSVYDIFGCFLAGGTLVLPDDAKKKNPKHLLDLMIINKVTVWNSVPAQMKMVNDYIDSLSYKVNCFLKVIMMSGDWIPVELPESLYEKMPQVKVVSLGGATEAAIWSIYYDVPRDYEKKASIPYGYPLANQKFYVLNSCLQDCPDGVPGDLYIGGMGLAEGYFKDEEKTNDKFIYHSGKKERIYMTGDVGRYDKDGCIEFLGRSDNQVKVRGHRIELSEIDSILGAEEKVSESVSVVIGNTNEDAHIATVVVPNKRPITDEERIVEGEEKNLSETAESLSKIIDKKLVPEWLNTADKVVLSDIYKTFKKANLFEGNKYYSYDDIVKALNVPEKFYKLLRRWLSVLVKENIAEVNEEGMYRACEGSDEIYLDENLWNQMYAIEDRLHYSKQLVDFLKKSSDALPQLIAGEADPLDILFPKGQMEVATGVYHDYIINRILNGIATSEMAYLAKNKKDLKILEVGAGVGGTSLDVIPALKGLGAEYNFTDLSTFFLNNAKEKLKEYDFVKYGIFDINVDVMEQQYEPMSMDVILAANVLHNAKNIHVVMDNLKKILKPGGRIVFLDETRETYTLMTSMEFKDGLSGFTDERAEHDQTFINRQQWENIFSNSGADIVYQYPEKGDVLELIGQTIYVIQFNDTYEDPDKNRLLDLTAEKLPEYMVPTQLAVWPGLPHTANGKIDRKKMVEWLSKKSVNTSAADGDQMPQGDLEQAIAKIWCRELSVESIGRNDNFYLVGGDSLLIAKVIGKMKEEIEEAKAWEWDDLLKEMMKTPTIRGLAKSLTEKTGGGEKSFVVLKEPETDKKQKATVVFHAGTGTLTPYNMLIGSIAERCTEDDALFGFTYGDEAEYLAMPTQDIFSLLGQKYGKILKEQGYEEYVLIGHCVGGLIALETAHFLQDAGVNVSSVTMLSTSIAYKKEETALANVSDEAFHNSVETSLYNELLLERTFAGLISADIYKAGYEVDNDLLQKVIEDLIFNNDGNITVDALCGQTGEFELVGKEFTRLKNMSATERMNALYATIERPDGQIMEHQRKMLNVLFRVFAQNFRCVSHYTPKPYTGKLRVFECEDALANFFPSLFSEDRKTWEPYAAGEFYFGTMKGDHLTCMNSPYIEENAVDILNFDL